MCRPTVSVIIPTYNSGRFVGHAIESVLAQSFDDVELIVVDDGSTDGTVARVRAYGDKVKYVTRPNGGPGAARNHGARLASGEWLAFLDADDFWFPNKLAGQLAMARRAPDLDVIVGNYHVVDEGGRLMHEAFGDHPLVGVGSGGADGGGVVFGPESGERYVAHRFGILSTTLVRAELFRRVGGFDERLELAEDIHLMIRLIASARSFGAVRVPVAAYRRRRDSMSHGQGEHRHRVTAASLSDVLHWHSLPRAMARAVRRQLAETHMDLAVLLARQGRRTAATITAVQALIARPGWQTLRTILSVNMPVKDESPGPSVPDALDPVELFRFGAVA